MEHTIASLQAVQSGCHPCQQHSSSLCTLDHQLAELAVSNVQLVRQHNMFAAVHGLARIAIVVMLPQTATDLEDFTNSKSLRLWFF